MSEESKCLKSASLMTTFVSDAQAYGVMFTVKAKHEMLLIETLEISAMLLAKNRGVHVLVYSKEGSYETFHDKPEAWVKVADSVVLPANDGRGTLIPPRFFHPVEITPRSERAFYVTLDTANLRYINPSGKSVGSIQSQDDFLQIHVGASLLDYPFSSKVFEPRAFCGIVHYKRIMDCNAVVMVDTKVSFYFIVQHDSMSEDDIKSKFYSIVSASISEFIDSKLELLAFKESADLKLVSVDALIEETQFHADAYAECISNTARICTSVVTKVNFAHADVLKTGYLTYQVLQGRADLSSKLNSDDSMDVVYVGLIPVQSDVVIKVDGVPTGHYMNSKQVSFFEDITYKFVKDKMTEVSSLSILNVQVRDQRAPSQRRLSDNPDTSESMSSIDIFTKVTGTLRPPLIVDFDTLTESTLHANEFEYIHELKEQSELSLDSDDGKYFAKIIGLTSRSMNQTSPPNAASSGSGGQNGFVVWLLIALLTLKLIAIILVLYRRRRQRLFYGKEALSKEHLLAPGEMNLYETKDKENDYHRSMDDTQDAINRRLLERNRLGIRKVNSSPQNAFTSSQSNYEKDSVQRYTNRSLGALSFGDEHNSRSTFSIDASSITDPSYHFEPNKITFVNARDKERVLSEVSNSQNFDLSSESSANMQKKATSLIIVDNTTGSHLSVTHNDDFDSMGSRSSDNVSTEYSWKSRLSRMIRSNSSEHTSTHQSASSQPALGSVKLWSSDPNIREGDKTMLSDDMSRNSSSRTSLSTWRSARSSSASTVLSEESITPSMKLNNPMPSAFGSQIGDSIQRFNVSSAAQSTGATLHEEPLPMVEKRVRFADAASVKSSTEIDDVIT